MASALVIYGLILVIIIIVAGLLFWWLRRFGVAVALLASGLALVSLVGLTPIPVHGGVTLVGQVLYHELLAHFDHASRTEPVITQETGQNSPRFAGALAFSPLGQLAHPWSEVVDDYGNRGWLDAASGLIWSNWTLLESDAAMPPLPLAKAHCARKDPIGYWALASNAEEALMWQAGGHQYLEKATTNTMSYSLDSSFGLELPSYRLHSPSSNQEPRTEKRVFSVRCVARSADAPQDGYSQRDIDLELWNTYQLNKLNGR